MENKRGQVQYNRGVVVGSPLPADNQDPTEPSHHHPQSTTSKKHIIYHKLRANMVRYVVYIKADIEGVSSISVNSSTEDICISVRNPLNQEEKREKVVLEAANLITPDVSAHERHRTEHPYHLALKWEGETNRSTARLLPDDEEIQKSMSKEEGQSFDGYLPMLALDCDGLEPYAFHPLGKEFIIVDKAGNEHKEVDLSSGDWSAYDIGTGSSSVMNLTSKIE